MVRRAGITGATAILAGTLLVAGCAGTPALLTPSRHRPALATAPGCATGELAVAFDFEGAAAARCVIAGPRSVSLLIGPEHAPPINPSPWYAFRYRAAAGAPVTLTLRYLHSTHRYSPKLTIGEAVVELPAATSDGGRTARVELPSGEGVVSAQPIVAGEHYAAFARRLERDFAARRVTLGRSLDGRPIEALRLGASEAPRLIVLLGRQHPPEVTGHYAMEPFVEELAARLKADPALARSYQVLAVPLINPDGVALGHWRANRGGVDLNRDWGPFTQPETRAIRDHLAALPTRVRIVAMIDFHSTSRNLFYVQGEEASAAQVRFVADWLAGDENAYPGYPFSIVPSNANPGSGTSKTWFHATYGVPAITYEVGDNTKRPHAAAAAIGLAGRLLPALGRLGAAHPRGLATQVVLDVETR